MRFPLQLLAGLKGLFQFSGVFGVSKGFWGIPFGFIRGLGCRLAFSTGNEAQGLGS